MKHRYVTAFPTFSLSALLQRPARSQDFGLWNGNVVFLSSARAAAFHAIRYFGIEKPRKILVPAYHCGVELEALLRAGADVEYYDVGQDMKVQSEDIVERVRPDLRAIFLIHYWGFPQDTSAIAEICSQHNMVLVEDCAHALFSGDDGGQLGSSGDAAIYSLPKTLPVPDGGILRFKDDAASLRTGMRLGSWRAYKAGARSLLEHLRSARLGPLAEMADFVVAMKEQAKPGAGNGLGDYGESPLSKYEQRMSGISKFVFRRSSGRRILSRRRDNYLCLLKRLGDVDNLEVVFKQLDVGVCPLFFPVVVENRDGLEQYLRNNRIGTFVFGRKLHPSLGEAGFPGARFWSTHVLGLPVHQDLCEQDMEAIAEKTKEWADRSRA